MPNTIEGKLFIVSTPIGNLEDITFRAISLLKEVDIIAAEDTRHVKKLLNHYGISKRIISYYRGKEKPKALGLIKLLKTGQSIALVSDAGTPGISDPGSVVIREAISQDIEIVPIPGVSSAIVALSVSGLRTDRFVFEGFLPRKKGKRLKRLNSLFEEDRTIILFESPYRVLSTLKEISEIFHDRNIVVAREITKIFEEFVRGSISEVVAILSEHKHLKGEFTLILEGKE